MLREETAVTECGCWKCIEARGHAVMFMVVCAECGNKRCPHATDHELKCTGSNEPGQPGSAYEHGSGAASSRRFQGFLQYVDDGEQPEPEPVTEGEGEAGA